MKTIFVFTFLSVLAVTRVTAQQVADFELTNVMSNQPVSLNSYPSCEGMVIIFTSNSCPYDEYYRGRIAQLATAYQDRVPVLLVNSLVEASETPQQMVASARAWDLKVPYLADS
jgi:hypothetical protein